MQTDTDGYLDPRALAYLHNRKWIHRDLKYTYNLFITSDGRLKFNDFAFARSPQRGILPLLLREYVAPISEASSSFRWFLIDWCPCLMNDPASRHVRSMSFGRQTFLILKFQRDIVVEVGDHGSTFKNASGSWSTIQEYVKKRYHSMCIYWRTRLAPLSNHTAIVGHAIDMRR